MNELNKRMSAIESLLNRLEEKMTPADEVIQTPVAPLTSWRDVHHSIRLFLRRLGLRPV